MATTTRKQREIAERQELLLRVAREILLERGYLGLTMDRVAEATEYSKGTVYQHFKSKEDLLGALAVQSLDERLRMFGRAATFDGRSRERMAAIGLAEILFVQLHPNFFRTEQILNTNSLLEKTSETRQQALLGCNMQCKAIVSGVVRDAIAQGDLVLPAGTSADGIGLTLWGMYFGTFSILHSGFPGELLGVPDPIENLQRNGHLLLDGYGWKPLSSEWDYSSTHQRILTELFRDEHRKIQDR